MKNPHVLACFLLLVPLSLGLTPQEDDLVFDDVGDESTSTAATVINGRRFDDPRTSWHEQNNWPRDAKRHQVERLWGVPDVVVPVGHVLKLRIPRQAFTGSVDYYEVFDANGSQLPKWMFWDDAASTLVGVPTKKDLGSHHLSAKAIGKHGDTAKDLFIVQVVPEKHEELKHRDGKNCSQNENQKYLDDVLSGGPLMDDVYKLEQYHCHWGCSDSRGSEHTVDGQAFAGELHLVHWNTSKYNTFAKAAKAPDGLAVLGVFLKVGKTHQEMDKIARLLPYVSHKDEVVEIAEFIDPGKLLPGE
ncbi:carbonic anhydrase 1 [Augochlora pura]